MWCKGLRQRQGLVVSTLPLAPRSERHRNKPRAFPGHISRPAQSRHVVGHSRRNARPAIVFQRVDESTGNAVVFHPRHRPDTSHEWRQRLAPPASITGFSVAWRGMATAIALRMGEPRNATPAQETGGTILSAECRAAERTHARQRQLEQGAGVMTASAPERGNDGVR